MYISVAGTVADEHVQGDNSSHPELCRKSLVLKRRGRIKNHGFLPDHRLCRADNITICSLTIYQYTYIYLLVD